MKLDIRYCIYIFLAMLSYLPFSSAYSYNFFKNSSNTSTSLFGNTDQEPESLIESTDSVLALSDTQDQLQKTLAQEHTQSLQDYSVNDQTFYSTDRLTIYNYTAYSTDHLKGSSLANGSLSVSDLAISFGYGMKYRLKENHTVGYEYISSFPYDRGQLVKVFWEHAF